MGIIVFLGSLIWVYMGVVEKHTTFRVLFGLLAAVWVVLGITLMGVSK